MMRAHYRMLVAFCLGLALLGGVRSAFAQLGNAGPPPMSERPQPAGVIPKELEGIGIEDKNGATLPRDVRLTGSDGRSFVVGEFMDGERPLVLVLAYYGCPMLCSMVLNGTVDALKGIKPIAGKDFRVLVVSFDPRDGTTVASEKRDNYLESYGRALVAIDGSERNAFEFATGDAAEVKRLADAVGFGYRWDEDQKQFAHAAGMFVVTPKGQLSQVLTGIQFDNDDVSRAIVDAQKGVWQSPLKSVLMYCFQYNPHTGTYVLLAGRVMRIGSAITIVSLAFLIFRLFRADRRKKAAATNLSQRTT